MATSKGSLAKEIFARCLLWSGAVRAIRSLLWRDRVLILVYHDPKPEALDVHLRYLLTIAEPIELADVHRPSRGRPGLRQSCVIVLPHLLTINGKYRIAPMPQRHAAETPSLAVRWRRLNTQ